MYVHSVCGMGCIYFRLTLDLGVAEWAKRTVHSKPNSGVLVDLMGQHLTDERLKLWCNWARQGFFTCVERPIREISLDLSMNEIGDEGCSELVELLSEVRLPVDRLLTTDVLPMTRSGCSFSVI